MDVIKATTGPIHSQTYAKVLRFALDDRLEGARGINVNVTVNGPP
ncbi:hypothetical protein [Siphonobacter sp. SORGH_AS_0500]|nr:hypothetical protein [Siphonobacter sp. SORGH_AS_0500]MDR6195428.1 hypothetical protein [Siphonobacter sp. SORGH_AS_0500]